MRIALLILLLGLARPAHAYAWMIKHGYSSCATCHSDPSGAGLLTPYGRAQGEILLSSRFGSPPQEASPSSNFLWNALTLPDSVLAGGGVRGLALATMIAGRPTSYTAILMQADVAVELRKGGFRANASLGAVTSDGSRAAIAGNVVSREHWLGYSFGNDDSFLVRAGRINLPFGMRSIEHTLYVRQDTRTDISDTQEDGVAFAYSGETVRAEVMAILGNYQVSPDSHRERGYSGTLELALSSHAAVGVSSLVTHAASDLYLRLPSTRQAHGAFARWAPWTPLVLMTEVDFVAQSPDGAPTQTGLATMLQADYEVLQGLHFIATGETNDPGQQGISVGGWLTAAWFIAPHLDIRLDLMERSERVGSARYAVLAYMAQGHVYF